MGIFARRGVVHLAVLAIAAVFFILFTVFARQYVYLTYQHLGSRVGLNFNSIAKDSYVEWIKGQSGEFENQKRAVFLNKNVDFSDTVASNILGTVTSGDEKWIEIDLSEQRLYMKEGARTAGSFL